MSERRTRHENAIMDPEDNVPNSCRNDGPDRHAPHGSLAERGASSHHVGELDAWNGCPPWWRWRSPSAIGRRPPWRLGSPPSLRWKTARHLLRLPVGLSLLFSADVRGADVLVLLPQLRCVLPLRGELPGVVGAGAGFLTYDVYVGVT